MNRRDSTPRSQQPGGGQPGGQGPEGRWDVPRQAGQWQSDQPRQAGGFWDQDEEARAAARRRELEARYADDARTETGEEAIYPPDQNLPGDRRYGAREPLYPTHNFDASGGNRFADFTSEDYGGRDFSSRGGMYGGGMHPSNSYRPTFSFCRDDYGDWREYGERRGFLSRAGDEIASWFGDHDAARRREQDHRGRGPSDYTRSDERIREDVNDSLTHDWQLDASHIRVTVSEGEVTLDGFVHSRGGKRRAEDLAHDVTGVGHVQNNLRVDPNAGLGKDTLSGTL